MVDRTKPIDTLRGWLRIQKQPVVVTLWFSWFLTILRKNWKLPVSKSRGKKLLKKDDEFHYFLGHKYSGFAVGGPCESANGSGYTVIVDQGFLGEHWMGPQILAHHLLLMLTSDLYDPKDSRRYCPNENSLLHRYIKAGKQELDQCVIEKLNQSNISLRRCLQDS